jgi:hypothetical protein
MWGVYFDSFSCFDNNFFCFSSSDEVTGDNRDVVRISRKILNRAIGERTICKQECVTLLGGLDLHKCTESPTTVSMTGWHKVGSSSKRQFLHVYQNRSSDFEMSLHQCFYKMRKNNKFFPHYTGTQLQAKYPPTIDYARSVLLTHKPWRRNMLPYAEGKIMDEFDMFISSAGCPATVKVNYERAKQKHQKDMTHVECVAGQIDDLKNNDTDEDEIVHGDAQFLMDMYSKMNVPTQNEFDLGGRKFERGLEHDWSERIEKVSDVNSILI